MGRVLKTQQPADIVRQTADHADRIRQAEARLGEAGGGEQVFAQRVGYSIGGGSTDFVYSSHVSGSGMNAQRDFVPGKQGAAAAWLGTVGIYGNFTVPSIPGMPAGPYGVKRALVGRVKAANLTIPPGATRNGWDGAPSSPLYPVAPVVEGLVVGDPGGAPGVLAVQGAFNSSWYPAGWSDAPASGDLDLILLLPAGYPDPGVEVSFGFGFDYMGYALERVS